MPIRYHIEHDYETYGKTQETRVRHCGLSKCVRPLPQRGVAAAQYVHDR